MAYAIGMIQGRKFVLYVCESFGRPKIIVWTKRKIMSKAAKAASWLLKQFRIPLDVNIHMEGIYWTYRFQFSP